MVVKPKNIWSWFGKSLFSSLCCCATTVNDDDGQTNTDLELLLCSFRSMGIKQLVIAVNKMDMVHWSQERYKQVIASLTPFLLKTGFKQENVRYVPVSGLGGENLIVRNSEGPLSEWSGTWGPTLAECINEYKPSNRDRVMKKPLRMSIADVYKHPRESCSLFSVLSVLSLSLSSLLHFVRSALTPSFSRLFFDLCRHGSNDSVGSNSNWNIGHG